MGNQQDSGRGGDELVRGSWLYREYREELDEIDRHKWFQSEKAGRDIGFDAALVDWITKHRPAWRRGRRP